MFFWSKYTRELEQKSFEQWMEIIELKSKVRELELELEISELKNNYYKEKLGVEKN